MNFDLEVVESIDSTTLELMRRRAPDAPVGKALLARTQDGGRGRSERVWESPSGGMYLSIVLKSSFPHGLSLLGAKALLEYLRRFSLVAQLRWPNDVIVSGRKVGGVLPVVRYVGNRMERAVLGVGLNVAQDSQDFSPELRPFLTTLAQECSPRSWDTVEVAKGYLAVLLEELEKLNREGVAVLASRCESDLEGLGDPRPVVLVEPGKEPLVLSEVVGLDSDGALRLRCGRLDGLGRDQRLRLGSSP